MTMFRVALCLVSISLPAQSPDTRAVLYRLHATVNDFATSWNAWTLQQNDNIISREDIERIRAIRKKWAKADRALKDAGYN